MATTTTTNVGTFTKSTKVTVKRWVPPKSKPKATPPPTADPTPSAPAPVDTPEPTKVSSVPPAPDRSTPTGRPVVGSTYKS